MSARLELALDLLPPTSWRRFEKFASAFLVNEFPKLADTSAPSGDGGRDAEIFSPGNEPNVLLQYSCTNDWAAKIRLTASRITQTNPATQVLIYVTPKKIGAESDTLKKELRDKYGIYLEIKDKSYFSMRENVSRGAEIAAESLAAEIVDPYLISKNIVAAQDQTLNYWEIHAAHTVLMLQLKDDTGEKGLTKLSFEAIVRSILVNTDSSIRIKRIDLVSRAKQVLSTHAPARVEELAVSALSRLVRRQIVRHHQQDDTVCLSHEEAVKIREHLALCELDDIAIKVEMENISRKIITDGGDNATDDRVVKSARRSRRVLEKCMYSRAESFAGAVLNDRVSSLPLDHLRQIVLDDISTFPPIKGDAEGDPDLLEECVVGILNNTSAPVYNYLKGLADAYTLMAFLRVSPDVQEVMHKVFSYGEIWLDTTIILPMLSETLLDESQGRIKTIIEMTRQAGIELYTTSGVLEELSSHLKRALACDRLPSSTWEGGIPFIYEAYVRAGNDINNFSHWVENFMGSERPIDDLSVYIEEQFGIKTMDLTDEVEAADSNLRTQLDLIWLEWHEKRRARHSQSHHERELDPLTVLRLAKHDTESYLGVIERRKRETASPLGYKCWWLTFDSFAIRVEDELRKRGTPVHSSPVLSLDFLSQYLSLGPVRGKVPKHAIQQIPLAVKPRLIAFLTPELLEEAKKVRLTLVGMPERVISRRVRDHLDAQRRKRGPLSARGTNTFFDEINDFDLES